MRRFLVCAMLCLATGCTPWPQMAFIGSSPSAEPRFTTSQARLTGAQYCAIGFDLAREIHSRVSLRRTVLLAPSRATACERHALEYLRRAGFRIDETGTGGASFDVRIDRLDRETVSAVATIGESLRITRSYHPVHTGVLPASAISVQDLNPDTYARRQ